MRLYVDNTLCDMAKKVVIPLNFDAEQLSSPEGQRSGRTVELWLPETPTNNNILGFSRDIYAASRFNEEHHTARIEEQGVCLFEGTAYLLATQVGDGALGGYHLRITDGGHAWIRRAVYDSLAEADIEFEAELTLPGINELLRRDETAVRMLPIFRSRTMESPTQIGSLPPQQVMLTDDFHPFISVASLVDSLFASSGYTLNSRFFRSDLFRSLYMSGEFSTKDVEEQRARCNFCARRQNEGRATANQFGRVYASPAVSLHSVGNIVDTADPTATDEGGAVMSDTFATNGSFSIDDDGFACFTPSIAVQAGFMLHLEYSTDYRIASRQRLTGFDVIEALPAARVAFNILNTHEDQRNRALPGTSYRAIIFDHVEGRKYRLIEDTPTASAVIGEFASRTALVTTESNMTGPAFRLYYQDSGMDFDEWYMYEDDWALYFGYVEECGTTKVSLDLRIPPQEVAAGESLRLDKVWFGGAEAGMNIALSTSCRLTPYFSAMPGYGSILHFEDVAPRNIRFIELLEALAQMFNLVFYTDAAAKCVYVEPMEWFYNEDKVVDWSDKIDLSKPIVIRDAAIDRPQRHSFAYVSADAASERYNSHYGTKLGAWRFNIPIYGTTESEKQRHNPLFTTTLNATGLYAAAPSASIMQVDERGDTTGIEAKLTPRIVRHLGMRPLPEEELWPLTAEASYPLAAFLLPSEGVNLCYEDHEEVMGLHHYYDKCLQRECERHRVTLSLRLTPLEISQLFKFDGAHPSVRSTFRLTIGGESSLFRLERITLFESNGATTECQFVRVTKDC